MIWEAIKSIFKKEDDDSGAVISINGTIIRCMCGKKAVNIIGNNTGTHFLCKKCKEKMKNGES